MGKGVMSRLLALSIGAQISLMALILVLPTAGIILVSGLRLREAAMNAAAQEIRSITNVIANEQQQAADSAEQLLKTLAQLPDIRRHRGEKTRAILRDILSTNPAYLNISALDLDGTVWASAITNQQVSVADRRYFRNALASGQFSSGEYIVSRMAGRPTLNLCYPYQDATGTLLGALTIAFDLDRLAHAVPQPQGDSCRYVLLDHRGVVLARSYPPEGKLGTSDPPGALARMQGTEDQGFFIATGADHAERAFSYRRLTLKGESRPYLYVRTGVPVATTLAQVNAMLGRNLILFISSLTCALGVAWLIGKHSIVNRVAVLRAASQRLADGDLKVRVSNLLVGGDLGQLGRSFDEMAQQLEARERERDLAEQAQRRSENRYRSLFENSLFGMVAVGPDNRFVRVNDTFCQLLGYQADELVGVMDFLQVTHPDDLPLSQQMHSAMVCGEVPRYTLEKRYLTKGGDVVHVVLFVERIPSEPGHWDGNTACILDITERKENQERMRLFFERQVVGMAITGPDKRWLQTNARLQHLLGYSAQELSEKSWEDLTHPDDLEKSREYFDLMLTGEIDEYVIEKRYLRRDGSTLFFIMSIGCVRRYDGSVDYVLALYDDITDRTRAEQEILLLQSCLEQRVQERTAQLERAVAEQEAFSYSVSHDLRSPLRHINSYLALLQEESGQQLPEAALDFLRRSRQASIKMGHLIDDLLELSRVSRSKLVKQTVNLSALAADITASLRESDPARRVEVEITPGIKALGDKILLGQVLENLLGNAWKYTARREGARLSFGTTLTGSGRTFYVRDNGAGFDMAYRDKLFGAFQRLHGEEYEGTGIGLATVKRIIDRHGGEVWAEAAPEAGATFYFTLP
ncbi:hypothetical protein GMLC_28200 [Geomonas limicola]|uniref:histidine kinase n=1 Tax=Geomonas limicola TaxID=2740186 RepID=A0A6V8N9M6_9BACT|nr:PAS domain S-box protein [Geomonas limicola]GFO69241.1 hypothetical protein GMLC_28200 [Geomonas limicola]